MEDRQDHLTYQTLPADERVLILIRIEQAIDAIKRVKNVPKANTSECAADSPAEALSRLTGLLRRNAMPDIAREIVGASIVFPMNDPYKFDEVTPNPIERLSRLERRLTREESKLKYLHFNSPMENATPISKAYGLQPTLGQTRVWSRIVSERLTPDELKEVVRETANFLRKLPLQERYAAYDWAARGGNHRPQTIHTQFRSVTGDVLSQNLVKALLKPPVDMLEIETDLKPIVEQFKGTTKHGPHTFPIGEGKGRR